MTLQLPSRDAFHDTWKECAKPLDLVARVWHGTCVGLHWPLRSWARYIASRPALLDPCAATMVHHCGLDRTSHQLNY